jgi:glycosyltransferase involved in cell wall biosynthesis
MGMKAAMLAPYISRRAGGLRDCVLNLSRSLKEGYEIQIDVVSVDDEFAAEDRALWDPLSVHLSAPRLRGFRYAPKLFQTLLSINPDLVHTHGLWTYLSVAAVRWSKSGRGKRPYIISPQGMLDPWALRNSSWKKRLASLLFERRHLKQASCLHAVNQAEAAAIRNFGLKNPICVIPNGVEIPASISELPEAPWSAELGNGRKVLLYLGRLHPKKGLPAFLRSWQKAISKNKEWILVIGGWDQGGHRSQLEQLVDQLAISDSVRFLGPLFGAQRDAAYQLADAFVLPSLSEGQPLAVLEAWSHALPVLMTNECNLREGFESSAAIRMEPNVKSGTQALQSLLALSETALQEMGLNGRKLVMRNFSWPRIAAQMHEVYCWILGRGAQPRCMIDA